MRERALLAAVSMTMALALLAPSGASAAFAQCPAVGVDTSCQFLITIGAKGGVTVEQDPAQGAYEGSDDALIGVQNNSSKSIASIPLSTSNELFGFEFDGLCNPGTGATPPGCVVVPTDGTGAATEHPGEACPPTLSSGTLCAFPTPAGEPAGITLPTGTIGFGANGDAVSGYEGPGVYFTSILSPGFTKGTVNFSPPIAPGGTAYFSLESPPVGELIKVGNASTVTTVLSAAGGAPTTKLTAVQGTPVTDTATVAGTAPTGEVTYTIYKDALCTQKAAAAGVGEVVNGVAKASSPISNLAPGTYYWQASYSGDLNNQSAASLCGGEILTVVKKVNFNLPSSKQCVSKRRFIAHPRFPKNLKIVKVEVLINGVLKHTGTLHGRHTTINLRGLPKGTFRVTMITTSITGATYGDTRVFHTCVPRHHKH